MRKEKKSETLLDMQLRRMENAWFFFFSLLMVVHRTRHIQHSVQREHMLEIIASER